MKFSNTITLFFSLLLTTTTALAFEVDHLTQAMKYLNKKTYSLAYNLQLNMEAYGGISGAGNGGIGIVCNDKKKKGLIKVILRDVFEGNHDPAFQLPITRTEQPLDQQITQALQKAYDISPTLYYYLIRELKIVEEHSFISDEYISLSLTSDIKASIYKEHCIEKTIAQYKMNFMGNEIITFDKNLYDKLPTTDKAALWMHEAIYALSRKTSLYSVNDSYLARYLTASLFSSKNNQAAFLQAAKMAFSPIVLVDKQDALTIDGKINQCPKKKLFCREYIQVINKQDIGNNDLFVVTRTGYNYRIRTTFKTLLKESSQYKAIPTGAGIQNEKIRKGGILTIAMKIKGPSKSTTFENYLLDSNGEYTAGIKNDIYLTPQSEKGLMETKVFVHYIFL